ncbi:MAG: hypothetical protein LBU68_00900 [Rickettsiales bacterium]|jgi:tetratricopeptide (TPR) repeat protein|nr:hypothetical protein [Rickettsiales bacterium]
MKKYLVLAIIAVFVSGCETMNSVKTWMGADTEETTEPQTETQAIISYIIDQSPTSPNAKPEAEALRKKALRLVFLGSDAANDGVRAVNEINRAIEIDQTNFSLYAARAVIYRDFMKEDAKALDDYNKAVAFNPDEISLYFNRAIVHKRLNNSAAAIADYNTAITKADNTYKGIFFKANAYQSLGMLRKDMNDYSLAEANLDLARDMYSNLYKQSLTNNEMQVFQSSYIERLEQVETALKAVAEMSVLNAPVSEPTIAEPETEEVESEVEETTEETVEEVAE